HPPAREDQGRRPARLLDPRSCGVGVGYEGVPGLVETKKAFGETTLVVDPARLLDACVHLRDAEGFAFLSDVSAADYLGWGSAPVAGYIGTPDGRDLNAPGSQGPPRGPHPHGAGAAGAAALPGAEAEEALGELPPARPRGAAPPRPPPGLA